MNKRKILFSALKILIILIISHIIEIAGVGSFWYALDLRARSSIATRLEIEPDWGSLEEYIDTHFEVGMSRVEVLRQAETIGSYTIGPFFIGSEYCEGYFFNVGPFRRSRGGRWIICYDENDVVTDIERYRRQ